MKTTNVDQILQKATKLIEESNKSVYPVRTRQDLFLAVLKAKALAYSISSKQSISNASEKTTTQAA